MKTKKQFNIPNIMGMSAQELLASLWPALESCKTKQVTETVIGLYTARAQMLGPDVAASVAAVVASYTPTEEKQIPDWLIKTRSGHVRQCVENYCRLFDHMYGDRTRLHDVLHMWQIYDEKTHEWRAWKEVDEAKFVRKIDLDYGLHSKDSVRHAMTIGFEEHVYDPILEYLDNLPPWDGKTDYMHNWLTDLAKADDTEYVHECAAIPIQSAVWRAYEPGTKVDDVLVLTGPGGQGKSEFCKALAGRRDRETFGEISQFTGKESIEVVGGAWVCEIVELLALRRETKSEAIKAFISAERDKWRPAYGRYVRNDKRRCIFIGTTNEERFLVDKTGNRRWYPVAVHCVGYRDVFPKLEEIQDYIDHAYAQAKALYFDGKLPKIPDMRLLDQYRAAQEAAMEDDWLSDAVSSWAATKSVGDRVCVRMIAHEVLGFGGTAGRDPNKAESRAIGLIMDHIPGWKRLNAPTTINSEYGKARGWERVAIPGEG